MLLIYLDNAATTRTDPAVLDAMMPYLTDAYGNAGTLYSLGREANRAVQKAREQVAAFIGAEPNQIIFTSGGSEANSLAIKGVFDALWGSQRMDYAPSAFEHDSVINSIKDSGYAYETFIPVGDEHFSFEDENAEWIGLVSCMYENNETGDIYNIYSVERAAHKCGALFHTDCVQAAYDCELDVSKLNCDFLSLSSHKLHGPKGAGALYVRDPSWLTPLISGGSAQEFGLRAGTENVAGIVGFGAACNLMQQHGYRKRVAAELQVYFTGVLTGELIRRGLSGIMHENHLDGVNVGHTVSLRFDGVDAETLVLAADARGVCISAGAACTSHQSEPSHVLTAMGLTPEEARSSVRVSFSRMNTEDEVEQAAEIIADCVEALRK